MRNRVRCDWSRLSHRSIATQARKKAEEEARKRAAAIAKAEAEAKAAAEARAAEEVSLPSPHRRGPLRVGAF